MDRLAGPSRIRGSHRHQVGVLLAGSALIAACGGSNVLDLASNGAPTTLPSPLPTATVVESPQPTTLASGSIVTGAQVIEAVRIETGLEPPDDAKEGLQ